MKEMFFDSDLTVVLVIELGIAVLSGFVTVML